MCEVIGCRGRLGSRRVGFSLNFCARVCAVIGLVLEPRIVLDSPFLLTTLEAL